MLTYLPTCDLVKAMSICRDFYEKIRDGKEFKQTLFLEGAPSITGYFSTTTYGIILSSCGSISGVMAVQPLFVEHEDIEHRKGSLALATPNPIFASDLHCTVPRASMAMTIRLDGNRFLKRYNDILKSQQGLAWSDMFICQPPCVRVSYTLDTWYECINGTIEERGREGIIYTRSIYAPDGVRVKTLRCI